MWGDLTNLGKASRGHRRLLCEALVSLAVARLAIVCLPFRTIAAWMGTSGAQSPASASPEETSSAQQIGWAVGALGRRVPWDGRCFAQALAAIYMLRRRGLEGTISFGVQHGSSAGIEAHAWVRLGSSVVAGESGYEQFRTLATFARKTE